MRCSAADTHIIQLDRVVSGASFPTRDMFECDIAHRRSVAVPCILYKIMCNQTHRLYGALPVQYVSMRVSRSDPWSHIGIRMRLLAAEPRSTAGPLFPLNAFSLAHAALSLVNFYTTQIIYFLTRPGLNYTQKFILE